LQQQALQVEQVMLGSMLDSSMIGAKFMGAIVCLNGPAAAFLLRAVASSVTRRWRFILVIPVNTLFPETSGVA
jgi:hypothetical protein